MRLVLAFGLVSCVALLAALAPSAPVLAAEAGVTAAVNPDAMGTPPGLATRVLDVGTNVLQDEHLTTGAAGQLQLLLRDGSTVTMGPNADMVVDKFVYDPDTNTAKLALTQTAGLMRIIGGRASKSDEGILITTPTAVIGIRGGIGRIEVNPQTGATSATLIYGKALTVDVDGTMHSVTRPGLTLSVAGKGQQPGPPTKAATDQVMRANALLEGLPGRSTTVQRVTDNAAPIRSANASGPSAESSFAAALSNPAFTALTSLQVGQAVTQSLVQNVLNNAAALANLQACSSCYNVGIGGGVTMNSASLLYTTPGGIVAGGNFGPSGYTDNINGGPAITSAVSYITILGSGTTSIQTGDVNVAAGGANGFGLLNPRSFVNSGSASAITTAQILASSNATGLHPAQYGAGGITAVNFNGAGVPTLIRNFFVDAAIDVNNHIATGGPNAFGLGALVPVGIYTITGANAIAATTTFSLNGAALAERVGDNIMQAVRTTGGSGTITETGTLASENIYVNEQTGSTALDNSRVSTFSLTGAFALSPTQSLHWIFGQPAVNLPTAGQFNYRLIGATAPTFSDGSGRSGVFSAGTLALDFGHLNNGTRLPTFTVNANVLMPGDAVYVLSIAGNQLLGGQTMSTFLASGQVQSILGSSSICSSAASCSVLGSAVLGGAGANHLGLNYQIVNSALVATFNTPGNGGRSIYGAAVFAR